MGGVTQPARVRTWLVGHVSGRASNSRLKLLACSSPQLSPVVSLRIANEARG